MLPLAMLNLLPLSQNGENTYLPFPLGTVVQTGCACLRISIMLQNTPIFSNVYTERDELNLLPL